MAPPDTSLRLVSVNVSEPRDLTDGEKTIRTGIQKEPVEGPVRLGKRNLEGDGQAHRKVHGGEDQAVYAYPVEHYGYWMKRLQREEEFPFGQFGENFTIQGLLEQDVRPGDTLRVGEALVEVTKPRYPCNILGMRMGEKKFPTWFMESGRTGFYLRVLEPGLVAAGDPIERVRREPSGDTIHDVWRQEYESV